MPHDPQTPADQQALGYVEGQLRLPEGFAPALLADTAVELRALEAPGETAYSAGEIALALAELKVRIIGRARRAGHITHGGIAVSLDGGGISTLTNTDGHYELVVPLVTDSPYDLVVTDRGYNAETARALPPEAGIVAEAIRMAGPDEVPPFEVSAVPDEIALVGLPGLIHGQVRLAAGFEDRDITLATISLGAFGQPELERLSRAPDPEGFYEFADVPPGDYLLDFDYPGFRSQSHVVQLPPGETVPVPVKVLSPDIDASRAILEGVVVRECALEPCDHGGIRIEAMETPFVALSARSGQFRLEVVAGLDYHLQFTAPGYDLRSTGPLAVAADETTDVGRIELAADEGSIRTSLSLRAYSTHERLASARLLLLTDPDSDDVFLTGLPDDRGNVFVPDVVPGDYLLRAGAAGYETQERWVTVGPGEAVFAGVFDLQHQSDGPSSEVLSGRVRLADAENQTGTPVRIRLVPDDLAFGDVLQTDADGRFRLDASPEERYEVRAERDGYESADPVGPLAWDADAGNFVGV